MARQKEKEKLKIIPLGGLEQIGMNMTAIEYGDDIIVIDCGLAFPDDDMLGVDLVIPDVTYLTENIGKVRAFFITHGHEDHIGALPYVLERVPVPVYGMRLTLAIVEGKLVEHPVPDAAERRVVQYGQKIDAGAFRVEFIRVNHSIVDAAALAIETPVGTLVHTGDFKIDYTPAFGEPADLARFAELGKKGVLAMLCESTNIFREGFTRSEQWVGRNFENMFAEHANSRIIVSTFASNVSRVQQIINTAAKYDKKVVVDGRSMVNIITAAVELGYIQVPNNCLIPIEELKNYPKERTVLITTGSQGESMAALSRMAANIHRKVTIEPGDTIILSSTPIPGNEKAVAKVMNDLSLLGAKVIFQDTHVSGHACREEIKLLYALVKPKYAIPIHGEFRHRQEQREMLLEQGWDPDNIFVLRSGDVLEL
ncbi:MAG: ribonuclease J, partial [Lachnospiraceae bacterium]|nr:ribonuclease J [Lachnospiraceae bacterium]